MQGQAKEAQDILNDLLSAVRVTRSDVAGFLYHEDYTDKNGNVHDGEFVEIIFSNGYMKMVDITADSGIAMMREVLNHIN